MQRRRWWLSWAAIWALGGCPRMVDDGATGSDETMRAQTGGADSSSDTAGATLSDEGEDTAAPETSGAMCEDACPHAPGVGVGCQRRFMFGLNYAWHHFGGDFGGIAAWNQRGVSGNVEALRADLRAMKMEAGANVIRWWMFPDFRGDGVVLDEAGIPTGLGGTALADIEQALVLAEEEDVYLMLTLFSFDTFRSELDEQPIASLQPLVIDAGGRTALLEQVVRPVAAAVAASPHRARMVAWDVINEPEWAIEGPSPYGDEDYTPNIEEGRLLVTHAQMETFLAETIAVLREESDALVSIGAASFKWARAWKNLDTDFHQFHMYDWIDEWWPHANPPANYDLGDKPVVMGEFPLAGLASAPLPTMLENWWHAGYAGALGWAYSDPTFNTPDGLAGMKAFADARACEVAYD